MRSTFSYSASIFVNVLLATTVMVLALHRTKRTVPISVPVTNEISGKAPIIVDPISLSQYPDSGSASDQRRWLIDQLRALGVPNKVLARVALEDLERRQNQYASEISKKSYGDPDTLAAAQLQFDKSLDTEMRSALGDEGFTEWDQGNLLREADPGKVQLTTPEIDAAYALWKKLRQRQLDLEQAKVNGTMDPADISDAFEKAAADFNQQMKDVLGEDRYAKSQQMDADHSATALQQDLANVNPNGSQLQELLTAQQRLNDQRLALDKQYQNDPSSPDYAAQLKTLNDTRDQIYQQVLGPDAFNTLQKQQDPGYTQMKQNETLWGLNDSKVDFVYDTIKYYDKALQDYQQQIKALQAQGQNVDWDGVNKNLQQFSDQTQQSLQNYLGQDTFNKMQQNGIFSLYPPTLPVMHAKP